MKVLVTGINYDKEGMIGSALKDHLEYNEIEVIPFKGDIREKLNFVPLLEEHYDMVIHLAAKPGVRESFDDPEYYEDVNVNGSINVFRFCKIKDIPLLYASSSNAHEWWLNPYAQTKRTIEHIADAMDLKAIGMRFHTVWPGRDDMLFKKIKNDEVQYINIDHQRDFIHIDDLCEAILTIMNNFEKLSSEHKIVDIGSGISVNTLDVFLKYAKPEVSVEFRSFVSKGERIHTEADIEYLEKLGWKAKRQII